MFYFVPTRIEIPLQGLGRSDSYKNETPPHPPDRVHAALLHMYSSERGTGYHSHNLCYTDSTQTKDSNNDLRQNKTRDRTSDEN